VFDTVLQARTVLAGVKAFVVVLNRVLLAFIACVQKNFFLGHLTVADPSISHFFENRNKCYSIWRAQTYQKIL
jgi:hypothetical protein